MSKPEWLEENERKKRIDAALKKCGSCMFFGKPARMGKRGKVLFECMEQPGHAVATDTYACTKWQKLEA